MLRFPPPCFLPIHLAHPPLLTPALLAMLTSSPDRLSFGLQEADYLELFSPEPSFPHSQFAMAADSKRLNAYYKAMKVAMAKAAARKAQQMQAVGLQQAAALAESATTAAAMPAGQEVESGIHAGNQHEAIRVNVLDMGCGAGALSCLAVAAAGAINRYAVSSAVDTTAIKAAGQQHRVIAAGESSKFANQQPSGQFTATRETLLATAAAPSTSTTITTTTTVPVQGAACCAISPSHPASAVASGAADAADAPAVEAAVVAVELVGPLTAVAVRTAARNGCSAAVSVIHDDAAKLERGLQVPAEGVDLVVFDLFDSGDDGHTALNCIRW
jgi:hypothetical protein